MKNFLHNLKKVKRNGGQALIISVIFFLFISLAIVTGLVSPTIRHFKIANDLILSKRSFLLSESGIEDAYFRLKNAMTIGSTETITLNGNTATTEITDSGYNEKSIVSIGDVSSRQRTNTLVVTGGVGVSFSYGVQVGTGGFTMNNGSSVQGSVYSNGSITGSGAITGSATSANSSALTADQTNGSGTPLYDVTFGNANGTQDFAQSFQISDDLQVNKAEFYLKKVGAPGSLTVKIVKDSSGSPSTLAQDVLASGTLDSSTVSTNYPVAGWPSVSFSTNPELVAGTTYWIVLDSATNATRYYMIGANDNGYGYGTSKIYSTTTGWGNNSPSTLDGFFKLYTGGLNGLISGITIGSAGVGNAYAHTINSSTVAGTKYCQSTNNSPTCNTSLADPVQVSMPISDQNIIDWQNEADAGDDSGSVTVSGTSTSIGPRKITGNLSVNNNGHLTITGTVWVTGNVYISNNAYVALSSSYGSSEGVIIVDGTVNIGNNANFSGSGTTGSYLMVLSTSTSTSAITLSNNAGAVILYAANGTVNLANNASAKSLNGKYIALSNNATVIYDSGLANSNFVNGPSGGWGITSWQETE